MPDNNRDQKTEKASPHRRLEARKKGNIFQSKDLISGMMIVFSFVALRLLAGYMLNRFIKVLNDFINLGSGLSEFSIVTASRIMFELILNMLMLSLPILLVAMILGFVLSVSQTRFIFTTDQLKPKLSRLNPIEGFKKMISLKALVELVKSVAKVTVIVYIVYVVINSKMHELPKLMTADISAGITWVGQTVFDVALYAGIGMIIIGVLDFIYQWWEYERSLMMSKQEVRDEYKQLEGDPLIKSRIRSIREKKAHERMMAGVKEADVVIRNPEHFAVVLKYDPNKNAAPIVIAKGMDYVAMQIVKEAEKYNIATVEDPPLARSLYAAAELGSEIPDQFWYAVADIIFHLMDIKKIKLNINKVNKAIEAYTGEENKRED